MENPILLVNNIDPDQMPHYKASDLGLHYLPLTLLWVSQKSELKVPTLTIFVILGIHALKAHRKIFLFFFSQNSVCP